MILFFALHLDEDNVKHRAPVSFIAKFGSSGARVVSRGGADLVEERVFPVVALLFLCPGTTLSPEKGRVTESGCAQAKSRVFKARKTLF
jgi:hypothetical protein